MANSLKERNTIAIFSKHTLALAIAFAAIAFTRSASGQTFGYTNNDLALGFRKTGIHQESYEAVVNIGSATNYANLQPGTTIDVPGYTASQLSPDTFSDLNFLSWSVAGFSKTNTVSILPGYVNNTLWLTVPRLDPATQSAPPARLSYTAQGSVVTQIKSIFSSAAYLSGQSSAGPDNTATFVQEPVNNSANLSAFLGAVVNSTGSTLHDTWTGNVESTTPGNFSTPLVADFYEVRPASDAQGHPVTDPHTGQNSGDAYYLGFFSLKGDGTLAFTRGSGGTVTNPPPSAPTLSVARTDNATQISFASEKGGTYTLYYTDAAGLDKPLSSWTSSPTTISGDGTPKQFNDTTADQSRFYRVSAK